MNHKALVYVYPKVCLRLNERSEASSMEMSFSKNLRKPSLMRETLIMWCKLVKGGIVI